MITICENCGKKIPSPAQNKKFCSSGCRQLNHRKKHNISPPPFLEHKIKYKFSAEQEIELENISEELKIYIKIKQELIPLLEHSRYEKENLEILNIITESKKTRNGFENVITKLSRSTPREQAMYEAYQKKFLSEFNIYQEKLNTIDAKIIGCKNRIAEITRLAQIEKAEKFEKRNSKFLSGKDILKIQYDVLDVDGDFLNLIGKPSKVFYGLVWGNRKGGKSSFAIRTAQYLTKFGKVLYWAAEEQESLTLQNKIELFQAKDVKYHLNRNIEDIVDEIHNFNFLFIDSATLLGLEPEYIEELREANPDTSFIVLLQSLKGGAEFKGSQTWVHATDFNIKVEREEEVITYTCEGRFGNNIISINI